MRGVVRVENYFEQNEFARGSTVDLRYFPART